MPHRGADAALRAERRPDGRGSLVLRGSWRIGRPCPGPREVRAAMASLGPVPAWGFDCSGLEEWDSALLPVLIAAWRWGRQRGTAIDPGDLPEGARRLLHLATRREGSPAPEPPEGSHGFLDRLGERGLQAWREGRGVLTFLGEVAAAGGRLVAGRARFPLGEFGLVLQDCGAQALPIVSLISVLAGLILAFVGAVQLQMFGAQIYVANLVGLGMAREMGAMMTAVIMAGRTGAAFAAHIGTMQVNEEIDALQTLGVSPVEFLVLPRVAALAAMMPLLCLYADFAGILGGALVGAGMLDLPLRQYLVQTQAAVPLRHFAIGLVKSTLFGLIVALTGCYQGLGAGRSATAVGRAATRAVVTAIVWIVVVDALVTLVCDALGV